MTTIPNPDWVLVSYYHPGVNECRYCLFSCEDAREHFNKLPEPLKSTYSVRPAEPEDFERDDLFAKSKVTEQSNDRA